MWKYVKKYKYQNFMVSVFAFLETGSRISCSLLLIVTMHMILEKDLKKTLLCGGVLVGLGVFCEAVVFPGFQVWKAKALALMNQAMRADINKIMMNKDYQELRDKDSGEYLSWYTNDIKEAEIQGFNEFYLCVFDVLKLILNAAVLALIRLDLLICTLVVSVALYVVTKALGDKIERSSVKISGAMEQFTDEIKEQLSGFMVWKAFGHLAEFEEKIRRAGSELERSRYLYLKRKEKANLILASVNKIGGTIMLTMICILCTMRILPVEILFGGTNFSGAIRSAFASMMRHKVNLAGARAYFRKFEELTKEKEEKAELPAIQKEITVEHLSFSYGEKQVLKDVNAVFEMGGKYAVVGKSGCGKSTLLKILLGQMKGYQGKVLFDGKDAGWYDIDSFGKQMAYIEQDVFLFNKTIRENITLGKAVSKQQMEMALKQSALWEELKNFPKGLDTIVGENGNLLSGGQKQRVAVARALVHNCSVLVMDEGTSALDQKNAEAIEDALTACSGLTVILVSHHLKKEKEKEFTAVYHLDQGEIRRQLCGTI